MQSQPQISTNIASLERKELNISETGMLNYHLGAEVCTGTPYSTLPGYQMTIAQ